MSSEPVIIFWIGLTVISGEFPRRFLKCSFQLWSFSFWLAVFNFALWVLFLLLILFTVCHANHGCLSSTDFFIFINLVLDVIVLFGIYWLVFLGLSFYALALLFFLLGKDAFFKFSFFLLLDTFPNNVWIISEDSNVQIGKDGNYGFLLK